MLKAILFIVGFLGLMIGLVWFLIWDGNTMRAENYKRAKLCYPYAQVASFQDNSGEFIVCAREDGGSTIKEVK